MTILDTIIAEKRQEVARLKEANPPCGHCDFLCEASLYGPFASRTPISFSAAIRRSATGIIAECKRKSPSKGWIFKEAEAVSVVKGYQAAGAAAVSVLTDGPHFGGSGQDLMAARSIAGLPLLRKDFIVDPLQVCQSKALGADVILLIAAALSPNEVRQLASLAHSLSMEVLLEIHSEAELASLCDDVDVVGVNNRDLGSFEVSVETSIQLADKIPDCFLKISESGLSDAHTVKRLQQVGYKGFLMGETFMKEADPGAALAAFIMQLT